MSKYIEKGIDESYPPFFTNRPRLTLIFQFIVTMTTALLIRRVSPFYYGKLMVL